MESASTDLLAVKDLLSKKNLVQPKDWITSTDLTADQDLQQNFFSQQIESVFTEGKEHVQLSVQEN